MPPKPSPSQPLPHRLLLVDDDLILLETLQEFLGAEGFQVVTASSGEQADALLQSARPPFELVLTDLVMPGRTGMDVLKTALARNPGCTVLVLSGYGTVKEATLAMDQGAYGLVNKPLQLEAFRQVLRRIVERARLIRERDQYQLRVRELEELIGRLEAIQGRMEMLAQRMDAGNLEAGQLKVLKDLRSRGILDPDQFETACRTLAIAAKP